MRPPRKKPSPEAEARRLEAVRRAAQRPGYGSWSTGPRTAAGRRAMGRNAERHGVTGQAFRLALQYLRTVAQALEGFNA